MPTCHAMQETALWSALPHALQLLATLHAALANRQQAGGGGALGGGAQPGKQGGGGGGG